MTMRFLRDFEPAASAVASSSAGGASLRLASSGSSATPSSAVSATTIRLSDAARSRRRKSLRSSARRAVSAEARGLQLLGEALDGALGEALADAAEMALSVAGRIVLCGMGKSSHVGRKIASTLASTGAPAMFLHPGEASHGDLGSVTPGDLLIVLSNSGETAELKDVVTYSRRFGVPLVAITSNSDSALARIADLTLAIPAHEEACGMVMAPTTSSVMQMALGDALAVALLEERAFKPSDFHVYHPGGSLGAAMRYLDDLMHRGDALPLASPESAMSDALVTMAQKGFGYLGAVRDGVLEGIVTDGDLRRHMSPDLLDKRVGDIMTSDPIVAAPRMPAAAALRLLNRSKITGLFVVDEMKRPVGFVHVHDLMRAGVI